MKVLVTGSNGQLGKYLGHALAQSPWSFVLLSRNDLDISCKQSVFELITTHTPDIIINAAAYTAVDKAEMQPELIYAVNAHGAGFLASAAKSVNAAIIHVSTDYIFSGNNKDAYKEEDPAAPINIYGSSKYAGEVEIIQTNPQHLILRTSWVFSEYGSNFFQTMRRIGRERNEISVVNDQFGGPTYAGDLADAILRIIGHYQKTGQLDWGIYHYCGHPYVSWFELAQEIFAHSPTGYPSPNLIPISTADYSAVAKRPYNSRLNCAKINAIFGIEPSNWKSAIKNLSGKNK